MYAYFSLILPINSVEIGVEPKYSELKKIVNLPSLITKHDYDLFFKN